MWQLKVALMCSWQLKVDTELVTEALKQTEVNGGARAGGYELVELANPMVILWWSWPILTETLTSHQCLCPMSM